MACMRRGCRGAVFRAGTGRQGRRPRSKGGRDPGLHRADRVADARHGGLRGARPEGSVGLRRLPRRQGPGAGQGRFDLHRRRCRDRCGGAPGHGRRRRRDLRRRLLRRHHRDHQQCLGAQRRGHHLAVGDLAGAHHDRGQRPLLPHRALRRAAGPGAGRGPDRARHRQRRGHLHQQRLRQGAGRQLRRGVRGARRLGRDLGRARGRQGRLFGRGGRAFRRGRGASGRLRLCRPGRQGNHPDLRRYRRLRELHRRRRHDRRFADRGDRRCAHRHHRHRAGLRLRGRSGIPRAGGGQRGGRRRPLPRRVL